MDTTTALLTSGSIARLLNADAAMVRHVIATRQIAHINRAGFVRIFAPSVIEEVRVILASMEKRGPRKPVPA